MSTAETIYELVKTLPEEQANLVLKFTQFVRQQGTANFPSQIPAGTLTGLRGIAKPRDALKINVPIPHYQLTQPPNYPATQPPPRLGRYFPADSPMVRPSLMRKLPMTIPTT